MNTCGCRQCGGPEARADALLARRVVAYSNEITHRRGDDLRNRHQRADLYTRLALVYLRGAEGKEQW